MLSKRLLSGFSFLAQTKLLLCEETWQHKGRWQNWIWMTKQYLLKLKFTVRHGGGGMVIRACFVTTALWSAGVNFLQAQELSTKKCEVFRLAVDFVSDNWTHEAQNQVKIQTLIWLTLCWDHNTTGPKCLRSSEKKKNGPCFSSSNNIQFLLLKNTTSSWIWTNETIKMRIMKMKWRDSCLIVVDKTNRCVYMS